jgi:hypothetical protein
VVLANGPQLVEGVVSWNVIPGRGLTDATRRR